MKRIFSLLLSGVLLSQLVFAQIPKADTLSFLHITDLHVIFDQKTYTPDFMQYRERYKQDEYILRNFLKEMPAKTKSQMVMATGDMVDFFEVDLRAPKYLESQVKGFSKLIKKSPVPVYCALGNHDMFSFYWKNGKLKHDQNSAARSRAYWTRNVECFKDGITYSKVFNVGQTTYRLIFLDNALYQFDPAKKSEVPYVDKSQVTWLKSQLKASDNDIEIVFMHIPFEELKTGNVAENELYSILIHDNAVKLILAGHTHKNRVSLYPAVDQQQITQVQTSALAKGKDNWRQVRLTEGAILVSHPGTQAVELTIPVK